MILILVELNGLKQLKKIDNDFVAEIIDNMEIAFPSSFCKFLGQKNSVFLYSCTPSKYDLPFLFYNTINFFNYLKSISNSLLGYNILLDQLPDDSSNGQLGTLCYRLFLLKRDTSLYITKELIPFFGSFAKFESEGIFNRLVSCYEKEQNNKDSIASFLSKESGIDMYLESLTPFINTNKHELLYFYSKKTVNLSYISFCIAYLIQGKTVDVPWLYISSVNSKIFNINSLINCMNRDLVGMVENYLTGLELTIWKDLIHLIVDRNRMIFDEDIVILFRIYLKAYSSRMAELYLPAIVFINGSYMFEVSTLEYIANILEDLYIDLNLCPILFSNEENIPASFHGFPAEKHLSKGWILNSDMKRNKGDTQLQPTFDSPVSFYHSSMLIKHKKEVLSGIEATYKFLSNIDYAAKYFLMFYYLFYDLCEKEVLISYLSADQSEKFKNENLYDELVLNGFINPDSCLAPVFSELEQILLTELRTYDLQLIDKIIDETINNYTDCKLAAFEKVAYIYRKLELNDKEVLYLLKAIALLIDFGKIEIADLFFKRIMELKHNIELIKDEVELRQNIYLLEAAIYDNKDDSAADIFLNLSRIKMNDPKLDSERKVACSNYLYSVYKYKSGFNFAKLALLDIQDSNDTYLITRINFNLARAFMGMKRIDESKDYLRIAKETANKDNDVFSILKITTNESVVNFIYCNFSESLRLVANSKYLCNELGRRDWELFLIFMNGRILFELGNYKGAVDIFTEGLRFCDIYFNLYEKTFFYIWLGRCFIYLGQYRYGIKILNDYDSYQEALYFIAEGLYFQKDYNNAFKKIESAFSFERDRVRLFCPSNIIAWEGGYDFIEDRSLVVAGGHGVLFQLIRAFRAFLMTKTGNIREGRIELTKLMREEFLSDIDPNNGYYYYLHALTFYEDTGAEIIDKRTLLSKALRHVHKTSGHIDRLKERQQFLTNNYWNSCLMKDGRKHKLI